MNTMFNCSRQVAILLAILLALQTVSFAADVTIPAKIDGPASSLEAKGKSIFFLPSLKDEQGNHLRPADNGKWTDKQFLLPEGATEDRDGYFRFMAAIHKGGKKSGRKSSTKPERTQPKKCLSPVACPKCEPTIIKLNKSVEEPHPFFITEENLTVKVGESEKVVGFSDESGKAYSLDANQTVAGVAKYSSAGNTITITGQKPGEAVFTIWVSTDQKVRKHLNVKVVSKAESKGKRAEPDFGLAEAGLALVALTFLVLGYLLFGYFRRTRNAPKNNLKQSMKPPPPPPDPPTVFTSTSQFGRPLRVPVVPHTPAKPTAPVSEQPNLDDIDV